MSNAVKYKRPHGKITLEQGVRGNEIFFSVIDTDAGISETHINSLFKKNLSGASDGTGCPRNRPWIIHLQKNVTAYAGIFRLPAI